MFLFSFAKDGHKNYLLGTSHSEPFETLPQIIQGMILSKQSLVMEHDLVKWKDVLQDWNLIKKETDQTNIVSQIIEQAISCSLLDTLTLDIIRSKAKEKLGVDISDLSLQGLFVTVSSASTSNGIDSCLRAHYTSFEKEVHYLESPEILKPIIDKIHPISVLFAIRDIHPQKAEHPSTAESLAYRDSKLLPEQVKIIKSGNDSGALQERNKEWLTDQKGSPYLSIPELHARLDDAIFAVGFLHLFGDHGILKHLLHEGYEVEKITEKNDHQISTHFTEEMCDNYLNVLGDA